LEDIEGEKMNEKELNELYKEYVKGRYIYRVLSREYLQDIKKFGLDPAKNPFKDKKVQLNKFFNLVMYLHSKGHNIPFKGLHAIKSSLDISRVMKRNLKRNYLDFSPNLDYNKYYLKMKGGSLVSVANYFVKEIIKRKIVLNKKQKDLVMDIKKWCKMKQGYGLFKIKLSREEKALEKAHFNQIKRKYLQSPFGSFENFKRVILKNGWAKYKSLLEKNKGFYIRVATKIPPGEIRMMK